MGKGRDLYKRHREFCCTRVQILLLYFILLSFLIDLKVCLINVVRVWSFPLPSSIQSFFLFKMFFVLPICALLLGVIWHFSVSGRFGNFFNEVFIRFQVRFPVTSCHRLLTLFKICCQSLCVFFENYLNFMFAVLTKGYLFFFWYFEILDSHPKSSVCETFNPLFLFSSPFRSTRISVLDGTFFHTWVSELWRVQR